MIAIQFKRWGFPDSDNDILMVEWPVVPRIGEEVMVTEQCSGEVIKVSWREDDQDGFFVNVWLV